MTVVLLLLPYAQVTYWQHTDLVHRNRLPKRKWGGSPECSAYGLGLGRRFEAENN